MLDVAFTSQFKKDMKRKRKQGAELAKIDEVITMLRSGGLYRSAIGTMLYRERIMATGNAILNQTGC